MSVGARLPCLSSSFVFVPYSKSQSSILEEIKSQSECVICLDTPKHGTVYQCENGHILCDSCHGKMQTCPVCRINLGKIRNLAVEKILAQYERPCKYNNYGCTALITANALEAHNDVCNYQLVPCPWHGCVKVISLSEMPNHLIEIHKICKLNTLSIGYDDMREIIKSHGTRLLNPALFTFGDFDFCLLVNKKNTTQPCDFVRGQTHIATRCAVWSKQL